MASRSIAVFGARGLLGSELVAHLKDIKLPFVTVSSKRSADFLLDFNSDLDTALSDFPEDISHGIICNGITNIDFCKENPNQSHQVNVIFTQRIIDFMDSMEVVPVFISSDLVYKGDRGAYLEDDAPKPTTTYGHQKLLVERYLAKRAKPFMVVRFSKLVTVNPDFPSPIRTIIHDARRGRTIRAAVDQTICPMAASDAASAVADLVNRGFSGIVNITSGERLTRAEFARKCLAQFGIDYPVTEISIDELMLPERRPKDNSMAGSTLHELVDIKFRNLSELIKLEKEKNHQNPESPNLSVREK